MTLKKKRGIARSTQSAARRAKALEVKNQIRRTEEEPMEMGTIERTLLQEHRVVAEGTVRMAAEPSKIIA
jgi:SOS-response transcriptional repressor LexA